MAFEFRKEMDEHLVRIGAVESGVAVVLGQSSRSDVCLVGISALSPRLFIRPRSRGTPGRQRQPGGQELLEIAG
jgi:hypothetical protein